MQKLLEVNRVEIIDDTWRAYTNYWCEDVGLSFQDWRKTLKIYLTNIKEEEEGE